jgi:uncharacterized membrane protein
VTYLLLKSLHMLSMLLLFGTGLGSAWFKWMSDRNGDLAGIAQTNAMVVQADWIFTTPTVIIQPVTGLWMLQLLDLPLDSDWIIASLVLYGLAATCWLPVVWLQIRMRNLSRQALATNQPLPDQYRRYARYWFRLGIPAFLAMLGIVFLMVFKPIGWLS